MSDTTDKNQASTHTNAKAPHSSPQPENGKRTRKKAEDENKAPSRANGGKSKNEVSAGKAAVTGKKSPAKTKRAKPSRQAHGETARARRGQKRATDLPNQRMLFVKFYIANGFNATQAALSAGYAEKSARSIGNELLTFPDIQDKIRTEARAMIADVDLLKAKWLRETERVAFADVTDVISFDAGAVEVKDSSTLTKDVTAAIESVSYHESFTATGGSKRVEVKMHPKMKAQEMLGKFLGLLIDKTEVEHSGTIGMTQMTPEEYEAKKAEFLARHAAGTGGGK